MLFLTMRLVTYDSEARRFRSQFLEEVWLGDVPVEEIWHGDVRIFPDELTTLRKLVVPQGTLGGAYWQHAIEAGSVSILLGDRVVSADQVEVLPDWVSLVFAEGARPPAGDVSGLRSVTLRLQAEAHESAKFYSPYCGSAQGLVPLPLLPGSVVRWVLHKGMKRVSSWAEVFLYNEHGVQRFYRRVQINGHHRSPNSYAMALQEGEYGLADKKARFSMRCGGGGQITNWRVSFPAFSLELQVPILGRFYSR